MNGLIAACVDEEIAARRADGNDAAADDPMPCDIVETTIPSVLDPDRTFKLYLSGVPTTARAALRADREGFRSAEMPGKEGRPW